MAFSLFSIPDASGWEIVLLGLWCGLMVGAPLGLVFAMIGYWRNESPRWFTWIGLALNGFLSVVILALHAGPV